MEVLSLVVWKLLPRLNVWPKLKFFKSRLNTKVMVTMSNIMDNVKGLITRNTHVQYENPIFSVLKVIAKVKVFQK